LQFCWLCFFAIVKKKVNTLTLFIEIGNDIFIDGSNEQLSQQIRDYNIYEGPSVGFTGEPSIQYRRFQTLCKRASDEELMKLGKRHKCSDEMLCISGLAERASKQIQNILKEHLNDTSIVESRRVDMVYYNQVNFIFASIVHNTSDDSAR
jgi:hypothetical protein